MTGKVLVTGAAGRVGRAFLRYDGSQYDLRLADRELVSLSQMDVGWDMEQSEQIALDVADLSACYDACKEIDTVVHLAADANAGAGFYESLLDNNIKGAYNIFRAAKDQGCRRVIWASSVQAVAGYPLDVQVRADMPPKPLNLYGAAKVFGEAMAHYFAYTEDLSSIAIRIGAFEYNRETWDEMPDGRTLSTFLSARDLSHLIHQSIQVENLQYAVLQAVSDNRFKRMDITSARELVGYSPQDDAFSRFDAGVPYRDRWYSEEQSREGRSQE
ncbi:MAG: NAD(P)-dependent oxidoreductase [Chloroflexota bacterium]